MPQNNLRLRMKRGDTSPAFRAQCQGDGFRPANLTGATARLLLQAPDAALRVLPLVVEDWTDGWVHHVWAPGETDTVGNFSVEVEVTYASGKVQTFPGAGYVTLEILPDLG